MVEVVFRALIENYLAFAHWIKFKELDLGYLLAPCLQVLRSARIVAMTTTGLAGKQAQLQALGPKVKNR
jgi:hypothetical protein